MRKRNIFLLCAITFLQGMVFYSAVATLYRQAAGLSIFEITAVEGAGVALSMVLEVPWGRAADRIGYRRTMIICNLLFLVTKIIFWKAGSFAGFLAERLLLAVVISGLSGVDSAMLYLSSEGSDAQRNEGICRAAGEAGLLLSGIMYTLFLSGQYRWAALWTLVAYALAAALTFLLAEVRPEDPRGKRPRLLSMAKDHFRLPGMVPLVVCTAVYAETVHCVTVYFSQLQYLRCGLDARAVGVAFLAVSAAGLCGPLSAMMTGKWGERFLGKALLLLSALCVSLLAVTGHGLLSVFFIVLLSALSTLFFPLAWILENKLVTSDDRATVLSFNAMAGDSLAVLLDLVLGRAANASLPFSFGLCAAMCLLAFGLLSRFFCRAV
ncbi:MAG: MFS transporter [Clostridia bacterium]|nr:MFS transporter [Clostridia bacterium]